MSDPSKERIKRYLKQKVDVKIEENPTQEAKDSFIKRKLYASTPEPTSIKGQNLNFSTRLRNFLDFRISILDGTSFKQFRKETLPMLAFIGFSSFILYKMQSEQDHMQRSVVKVKSQKQQLLDEEDAYIRAHLVPKSQLTKNQIQDVPDQKGKYKYEQFGDDGDDYDLSTKEDFLDLLRKDYNKGIGLPDQYSYEVQQYAQSHGKKLKYGEFDDEEDDDEDQKEDFIIGQGQMQGRVQQGSQRFRQQ